MKTEVSLWKRIKCFPSSLRRRNLKPIILDICLRKIWSGKSHDYRAPSFSKSPVFKMFSENTEKLAFSNSSGLKSVLEKLRSRDGLVWTVGLTAEIKLRFQMPPV